MNFIHLFYILIYIAANVILGYIFFKIFYRKKLLSLPTLATLSSAFLLGQGIFACIWLILGLSGQFKITIIWTIIIIVIILGYLTLPDIFSLCKKIYQKCFRNNQQLSLFWKLLIAIIALIILTYAISTIIRKPSGDAEAFYMVLPKILSFTGRLFPQPNYHDFSQIGLFGELHFACLMTIAGPATAKFITWFIVLAILGMLLAISKSIGLRGKGQIITIVILLSSTAFTNYITEGKVDLFGAALGLAAYYWVLQINNKDKFPLILTGLFAGFSCVAKFPNAIAVLPGILLILIWKKYRECQINHQSLKFAIRPLLTQGSIILLFVMIALIPHLVKNNILFHEPLAPFVFMHGPGNTWTDQSWFSPRNTRIILATYPIALIFGKHPLQGGNLSVLYWIFFPILLLFRPNNINQKMLLVASIICIILWMICRPAVIAPRYILVAYLILIPVIALSVENLLNSSNIPILKSTAIVSILIVLVLSYRKIMLNNEQYIKEFIKHTNSIQLYGYYYPSLEFINKINTNNERTLLAGYYGYYLKTELLIDMITPQEVIELREVQPFKWQFLIDHNYRYLIVQKASHKSVLQDLEKDNLPNSITVKTLYNDKYSIIFRIDKQ